MPLTQRSTRLLAPLKKRTHTSLRELLDREQRCEVARSTASVFRCKEGGQRVLVTFIPPSSKLHGGIAQLVERLVRNEKARGSNPLTSNLRFEARKARTVARSETKADLCK